MIKTLALIIISGFLYISVSMNHDQVAGNISLFNVPNLPIDHLIRYLNVFPEQKEKCRRWKNCSLFNTSIQDGKACWGYEDNCSIEARFQTPVCSDNHSKWVQQSKHVQESTFYYQADFGYVKNQINELRIMCEPRYLTDSSLECTKYLRFCRGRNLLIDFRDLSHRKELIRYDTDVLKPGQMLGHCNLNKTLLESEMTQMGALQSWSPELANLEEFSLPFYESGICDKVFNTPTFIMKIDATYNMYHHFCDFFNLYISLFVNQSHPMSFHTDVQVLIWESYPYTSPFADTFKAFTHHPVLTLNDVQGSRICFRNLVLPLLPRMIFGLYYNTPIVQGCSNSGLFRAFSEFILHRLQVPFSQPLENKLRITFLSRRTKYRRVKNERELLDEIISNDSYEVRLVTFERDVSFLGQLAVIRNTDIFIGIHGAGLTHLLFLPNWATIFELYNCEDPNCYRDLARLRGVNYITWEKPDLVFEQNDGQHQQNGAHAKFTNYIFDRAEFARLVEKAAKNVTSHKEFQAFHPQHQSLKKETREEL